MIIRDAQPEDFNDLERLGRDFAKAAGLPDVDADTLERTLGDLLQGGIFKVAVNGSVVGCAGAMVFPHWWNASEIVAQELFWFVDKEHRGTSAGIRLLRALEESAKERGATKLMMLCLDNLDGEKVAKMYSKLGYVPQEQTYMREL